VALKPGQQLKDFKVEMTPRAILSGRVVDENGDPMQGVSVDAVALDSGSVSMMQGMMGSMDRDRGTDDHGEFRLTVVPGKYQLKATARGNFGENYGQPSLPERRNDGSTLPPYTATFYPSTAVKARATTVDATPGRETSGLEIHMTRQQGLSITGIVSGVPEGMQRPNVQLIQLREGTNQPQGSRGTSVGPDGKFSFVGIEPATYRLYATYFKDGKVTLASRSVEVKVDGADPAPLALSLQAAIDASGTLTIEGDPPNAAAQKRTIRLEPIGVWINSGYGETDAKNNFTVSGVAPGKYHLRVDPMPENGYVKTIEMDGATVATDIVEVSEGNRSPRLKVTVSKGGGQIAGRVLDSEGNKLLTPLAMVSLLSGPNLEDVITAEITPNSQYTLKALRPGKYRLLGVNPFDTSPDMGDQRTWFLKLFDKAEEIEVKEGDRISKDVKLLSKEALRAKQ
jgi:hypothetical protein